MGPTEKNLRYRFRRTRLLWLPTPHEEGTPPLKGGTSISSLLLIFSVVLYATGFVVVSTSLERLGVAMPTGDFLKIQYVYVGVIAGSFVAFIIGISYLLFHFLETAFFGAIQPRKEIPRPSVFAMAMVAVGLYLQVAFAAPGSFSILSAIVLNIFILAWLLISILAQHLRKKTNVVNRLPLALVALAAIYLGFECATLFGSPWTKLALGPSITSTVMVGLPILQAVFVGRLVFRLVKQERRAGLDFGERFQWYFLNGAVVILLYYSTIVSFTVVCYARMPVRKGGADFTRAPAAVIRFKAPKSLPLLDAIIDPSDDAGLTSIPVVMLTETSFSFYVAADPFAQRSRWGKLGDARPPHVWEIPRDSVSGIDLSDQWPRPDPKDVNYVFAIDTRCTQQPFDEPNQPTGKIAGGTKAKVIRAESGHWLIWTSDGSIRAWVTSGLLLVKKSN